MKSFLILKFIIRVNDVTSGYLIYKTSYCLENVENKKIFMLIASDFYREKFRSWFSSFIITLTKRW